MPAPDNNSPLTQVARLFLRLGLTAFALGRATLVDGFAWGIGRVSALLLVRYKVNATWAILGGAARGLLLRGAA